VEKIPAFIIFEYQLRVRFHVLTETSVNVITLKVDAVSASEMTTNLYETTRPIILEHCHIYRDVSEDHRWTLLCTRLIQATLINFIEQYLAYIFRVTHLNKKHHI
jgi:hypothetical protein